MVATPRAPQIAVMNSIATAALLPALAPRVAFHTVVETDAGQTRSVAELAVVRGQAEDLVEDDEVRAAWVRAQRRAAALDRSLLPVVLDTAARTHPESRVLVPVQTATLAAPGFVGFAVDCAERAGLSAAQLLLGVRDGDAWVDRAGLRAARAQLRASGAGLALLGFGVAAASVAFLLDHRPEVVVFDPAVVRGCGADAVRARVLESLLGVVRGAGALPIAAGVDAPRDLTKLRALGLSCVSGVAAGSRPRPVAPAAPSGPRLVTVAHRERIR